MLAVGTDRQFQILCDVIGAPALAGTPVSSRTRIEWPTAIASAPSSRSCSLRVLRPTRAAALTEVRVPAGVVNDIASAFALAEALGLDPVVELPGPDGSGIRLPRTRFACHALRPATGQLHLNFPSSRPRTASRAEKLSTRRDNFVNGRGRPVTYFPEVQAFSFRGQEPL